MLPLIALIQDPRTGMLIEESRVRLSDEQARAILALTLSRLTGLGREEIFGEAEDVGQGPSPAIWRSWAPASGSWASCARSWWRCARSSPRRACTQIVEGDFRCGGRGPDPPRGDGSHRHPLRLCQAHPPLRLPDPRSHGGKGRSGMRMKEEDAVTRVFSASTHAPVLFFSSGGKVYKLKVWRLPLGDPNARGKPSSTSCPSNRAKASPPSCPCRRMRRAGSGWTSCSPPDRRSASQQALRLRQREPRRQDRHEAG